MNNKQTIAAQLNDFAKLLNQKNFNTLITAARERGLSISQVSTLFQLRYKGTISVSKIADKLGISNAAASQMLEGLVLKKFISRREDPCDRRVKLIEITNSGLEFLNISMKERLVWLNSMVDTLTGYEQDLIQEAVAVLISKYNLIETDNKNTKSGKENIC